MFGDPSLVSTIKAHAVTAWPQESCGVVTADGYVPLANLDPTPEEAFDCAKAFDAYTLDGTALALVHSHPVREREKPAPWPSSDDMRAQIAMDLPWGLLASTANEASEPFFWGDPLPRPPLVGRLFRHGPSGTDGKGDCYALIRDWFLAERDVDLVEGPRDWRWWETPELAGSNLYEENFVRAGFSRIASNEVRVGDVGLICIPSMTSAGRAVPLRPCHGVVYVGEGRVLHHKTGRKSCVEALGNWNGMVRSWIRHAALAA